MPPQISQNFILSSLVLFCGYLQSNHYSQEYLTFGQVNVGNVTSTNECVHVDSHHGESMEVIRQCMGVHYLLSCGSQALNSGCDAWLQMLLVTGSLHLPCFFL